MSFGKNDKSSFLGNQKRLFMAAQPARVLLIDSNVIGEEWFGNSVVEALEKIFLLGANLSGACPIPLIGIYVLTNYPELILPLTHTKSNFSRLHSALADLLTISADSGKLEQSKHAESCVNEGIAEACRQFKRYTANLPTPSGNFHQLEIVFMTTRQLNDVQKLFVSLPELADLNIIKRIVCANISSIFNENHVDSPDTAMDLMGDEFTSLVDVVTLEADPLSLQKFLYSWLCDSTTDTEQLQLILPPPSPVDSQLVIKCDLLERIINPQQLPIHDAFSLDIKSNICKHVFPPPSKAIGLNVSIFQLKILCSIPRESLCESIIFGQPLIVHPTGCWRIDWDCLEKNQQMFTALCTEMVNKDLVLLSCAQYPGQNTHLDMKSTRPSGHHSSVTNFFDSVDSTAGGSKPSGFFVLIPSEKSILIKSVVCGELYLPSNHTIPMGSVSEEHLLCVQSSLSKVEALSHFNPLDFQSGLFDALRTVSLPKSYMSKARNQHQRPQVTKKIDRPPVLTPGGRLMASSWMGTITDVSGTQMYHNKSGIVGKSKKIGNKS